MTGTVECSPRRPQPPRWADLRPASKLAVVAFCAFLCAVCTEGICRGYWTYARGVPFFHTDRIWDSFFTEFEASGVSAAPENRDDDTYDVLLLGGSVLSDNFGTVAPRLRGALAERLERPVRVFNLAYPGRTSLDSLLKYRRLGAKRFDLVVIYDNINDVVLNNVPPDLYRDDYSHAPRYEQLDHLAGHPEVGILATPFTLWYLPNNYLDKINLSSRPRQVWHHHGSTIRTATAFAANLEKMVVLAEERGDPVVLMTFAYHLTEQELAAAMEAETHGPKGPPPVAWWGSPSNVVRTLDAHNEMIRRVAARHPTVAFVDQQQIMPPDPRLYTDICHLSPAGCDRFVRNLVDRIDWRTMPGSGVEYYSGRKDTHTSPKR